MNAIADPRDFFATGYQLHRRLESLGHSEIWATQIREHLEEADAAHEVSDKLREELQAAAIEYAAAQSEAA